MYELPIEEQKKQAEKVSTSIFVVNKQTFPEEGGILSWNKDYEQPMKGSFHPMIIRAVNGYKAILMVILQLPILFFFKKKVIKLLDTFVKKSLNGYFLEEKLYCDSGRELLRVWKQMELTELDYIFMGLLMIWEFDDVYRYRGQVTLSQLGSLKNPGKGIAHLINEYNRRCVFGDNGRYESKLKLLAWIIRLMPKYKLEPIVKFLSNLDLEKIKLDKIDKYWTEYKTDFIY